MQSYHCSLQMFHEPTGSKREKSRGIAWLLGKLLAEKQARYIPQLFRSASEMCQELGLSQSRFAQGWRLTDVELGEINGLPRSRGLRIATDGVLCLIYRSQESVYVGHNQWFRPDEIEAGEHNNFSAKRSLVLTDSIKTNGKARLTSKHIDNLLEE